MNAPQTTLLGIPDGRAGVRETLKVMRRLLLDAKENDPRIRTTASAIISDVPGKNWRAQIEAIYDFVQSKIRYQLDPVDLELVQTPWETLVRGYGDCDDQALLTAALLDSIGHPTRFKAVGFAPGVLSHVYAETLCGPNWLSLDTTEPHYVGWEPPGITEKPLIIFNRR